MIFSSYSFIFAFLPIVVVLYFLIASYYGARPSLIFLVFSSLFFYGWWNPLFLPIILISMVINYNLGIHLRKSDSLRKGSFIVGVLFNLSLLGYFKYRNFFIENVGYLLGEELVLAPLVLPLAISFFTFQQIAYLVDSYLGTVRENKVENYALFITFFPQLIAGPIVHHSEMMPQFSDSKNFKFNIINFNKGMVYFTIGLFKKIVLADQFAQWANSGYSSVQSLEFFESWITTLSYSFQLYFDFSGYTDMAIGVALMLNIRLPINFDSPYKAVSIQDFWRRWHMTLSRFLRDYIYIPLGGNRNGIGREYTNLATTFLIGGFWHGAAWTFVIWGAIHGAALIVQRLWQNLGLRIPSVLGWIITLLTVHIGWVFFRSESLSDAIEMLYKMTGLNGIPLPPSFEVLVSEYIPSFFSVSYTLVPFFSDVPKAVGWLLAAFIIISLPNSAFIAEKLKRGRFFAFISSIVFIAGVLHLNRISTFLYFEF